MRVIAGLAKGHKLRRVPGDTTRPITDRVKENLFNIVGNWVVHTRWLDLFAGTGQVGIEALSRGAQEVVFIESAARAVRVIQSNLLHTKLSESGIVVHTDAFAYLKQRIEQPFDVIFVAPPQYKNYWSRVLHILDQKINTYLTQDGVVIVQIDPKEHQMLELATLYEFDIRTYGNTMLSFYERAGSTVS